MEKRKIRHSRRRLFIQVILVTLFIALLFSLIGLLYKNNNGNTPNFWNEVLAIVASILMSGLSVLWGVVKTKEKAIDNARKNAERKIDIEVAKRLLRDMNKLQKAFERIERRPKILDQTTYQKPSFSPKQNSTEENEDQTYSDKENLDFLFDSGVINERQYRALHSRSLRET